MSDQPSTREIGDPIPRAVVEEVTQLLGYEPREVVSVLLEARRVTVTTTHVRRPADLHDVVHVHTVF